MFHAGEEMITRRSLILATVSAIACGSAGAARADAAAKTFLEKIYAAYKGKNSKGVSFDTDAGVRRYFEPGLAALIIKDRNDAKKRDDVPNLDADPFVGGQDWEIGPVEIVVRDTAPSSRTAGGSPTSPGTARTRCAASSRRSEPLQSPLRGQGYGNAGCRAARYFANVHWRWSQTTMIATVR
jgi:hypothetical protein